MAHLSLARVVMRSVPWLSAAVVLASCASSEEDVFSVPYRRPSERLLSKRDASLPFTGQAGGAPNGGAPATPCQAAFCPSVGTIGTGCCMPNGQCGVDFGMGGCVPAPVDAGAGGGGGAGGQAITDAASTPPHEGGSVADAGRAAHVDAAGPVHDAHVQTCKTTDAGVTVCH